MTKTRCTALCLVLLGIGAAARAGDPGEPVVAGELGRKLLVAVEQAGGPGLWGSVLVAREGEILLARGYGFADYEGRPNTARTLFELASASKQVTAAAILHLQQRKKLGVNDTLDRFFKGLPEDKHAVTLHHLLTHTAGLSDELGVPYASPITRDPYVKQMLSVPLVAEPGARFSYSNVGYALLAAVVEEVTGGTFEAYVEKHLFKPAKMADSGFIGDRDLIRSERASSRGREGGATAADWHWGWGYKGMGGVVTTVMDLLRWDRTLRDDKVLTEESKQALFTPFKADYAYGWRVETTDRGTRKASHGGSVRGYGTIVVRYLDEDVCIFFLGNDGRAAYQVAAAVEKLLFPPVPLEADVDAGPYELTEHRAAELSPEATWEVVKRDAKLALRLLDGSHPAAEIRVPIPYAKKIVSALEQAILAREADDEGGEASVEAGLYLGRYAPGLKTLALTEELAIVIRPEYRGQGEDGRTIIDKRVLLYLEDGRNRIWPVMAKMNVAAARALLEAIRAATG